VNPTLAFLLSRACEGTLAPEHLQDLRKSGLTDDTIARQKIRSIPPTMINQLLGFETPKVRSAYLIPFVDPRGGWFDHTRMKIFPPIAAETGTIKYLQPRGSGVRIYFPLVGLAAVLHSAEPVYLVEGEKKALAVAQLGLPAIGLCGIEGWHLGRSRDLHPDLDDVGLSGRIVNLVPDADVRTNEAVHRSVHRLVGALGAHGVAEAKLVLIPAGYKGIDDYLTATA
jgi:hypothetical protein